MKRIVDIKELEGLDYEQGRALLEQAGYVECDWSTDMEHPYYDYVLDTYFGLYEEDEETEIDMKCFTQCCVKKEKEEEITSLEAWEDEEELITLMEEWEQFSELD